MWYGSNIPTWFIWFHLTIFILMITHKDKLFNIFNCFKFVIQAYFHLSKDVSGHLHWVQAWWTNSTKDNQCMVGFPTLLEYLPNFTLSLAYLSIPSSIVYRLNHFQQTLRTLRKRKHSWLWYCLVLFPVYSA